MSIEAMKLALEAFEKLDADRRIDCHALNESNAQEAITALRQAIEQAQKQEPVACVSEYECRRLLYGFMLDCNALGLFEAAENLHKGMKQVAHGIKE